MTSPTSNRTAPAVRQVSEQAAQAASNELEAAAAERKEHK